MVIVGADVGGGGGSLSIIFIIVDLADVLLQTDRLFKNYLLPAVRITINSA